MSWRLPVRWTSAWTPLVKSSSSANAPMPAAAHVPTCADDDWPEVLHLVCCRDRDRALCGCDLTGAPEETAEDERCVVCADLDANPIYCPLFLECKGAEADA